MFCPFMSIIIRDRFRNVTDNTTQEDLVKVNCLKEDCALYVIRVSKGKRQSCCGLINITEIEGVI